MATRKGICKNIFNCVKADSGEIQEVDEFDDFICSECTCKSELEEVGGKGATKGDGGDKKKWMLWAGIAVVVVAGAVGTYYLQTSGGEKDTPTELPDVTEQIQVESIMLDKSEISLKEGDSLVLTAAFSPEGVDPSGLSWSSANEAVATVVDGTVVAVGKGETAITLKDMESGTEVSCLVTVVKAPNVQTGGGPGSGTVSVTGGSYTGELKNRKPHGMGTIKYTGRTLISKRDAKGRYAEAGDYITGEFYDGELVQGKLFDSGNNQKALIIIGRVSK